MLIEGPFESDYSLAIVNRRLALALVRAGRQVELHQRDNKTDYMPSAGFLAAWPDLAPHFINSVLQSSEEVHSRNIYPPYTDRMTGSCRAMHSYAWEESAFPRHYVRAFNNDLDLITVVSGYVREVLQQNGVAIPIETVGNGADHILENDPEPLSCFKRDTFHFVHVSSCFPRKGVDVLVDSFCREFSRSEDARLIIKTFANPHNEIERIVASAFSRYPQHAAIDIIWESLSAGQMRFLLESGDCLIAPSRGEGFGLPVAEAMLLGTPVVATIHGGHTDLCSPEWMWPVEFRLAPARTHLTHGHSLWAEPDGGSLAARMREIYKSSRTSLTAKIESARRHIQTNFTWEQVALRHECACFDAIKTKEGRQTRKVRTKMHIGFVTTWNAKCGIAEYTRYLTESLSPECEVSVFANHLARTIRADEPFVSRCWTANWGDMSISEIEQLTDRILTSGRDAVSIQYNFALLSPNSLYALTRKLMGANLKVLVTLHGSADQRPDELIPALKAADAVFVHREEDRRKLEAAGLPRVVHQLHGIYVPEHLLLSKPSYPPEMFTVASFGFLLPPKGIYELLEAFEAAAFGNPALRLKLVNALYDHPDSHAYLSECLRFIRQYGLMDRVILCTDFLDQDTILRELSASDLVVLPYVASTESSSAAIRLPLASLTPVLCSEIDIFKEFEEIVHFYPAGDVVALCNRILELSMDPVLLRRFEDRQRQYVGELSWRNVARQFESIVGSCLRSADHLVAGSAN